ncbi:hypothetical protein C8J57DRAFT_1521027 [Mycena rebaudengoi]|nr:hypothetical protein C8J57DRAFT_1521027 [Mycena rebaudengoi]
MAFHTTVLQKSQNRTPTPLSTHYLYPDTVAFSHPQAQLQGTGRHPNPVLPHHYQSAPTFNSNPLPPPHSSSVLAERTKNHPISAAVPHVETSPRNQLLGYPPSQGRYPDQLGYPPVQERPAYHPYQTPLYTRPHSPPPNPGELLAQRITNSIERMLASDEARMTTRIARLEDTIKVLSSEICKTRQQGRRYAQQLAEILRQSHEVQTTCVDAIGELEQALGTRPDVKDGQNLLHKFDVLSFAVEELLELIKDPEAGHFEGPAHYGMGLIEPVDTDAAIQSKTLKRGLSVAGKFDPLFESSR